MLRSAPCKQCALDPAPTWLIKRLAGTIVPVIAAMCNASFAQEHLPVFHNFALIRSLLKKPTMYPNDLCSYCPISNLNFISKLVEQVVDMRFIEHADRYQLLAINQSAYRLYRSTETANVSVVHNDMLSSINKGYVGALVLLDMSAAFDTVDRAILVNVLQRQFDIQGQALNWFTDFTADRTQSVLVTDAATALSMRHASRLSSRPEAVYLVHRGRR